MMEEAEMMDVPSAADEDRLSNLPNIIKHDILSRLSTKDAVRTSVLSKDWRYQWTFLPCLSFGKRELPHYLQLDDNSNRSIHYKYCDEEIERKKVTFYNFLDQILLRRAENYSYTLQNFTVFVPFTHTSLGPHINEWLECAVACGVRGLRLNAACYEVNQTILQARCLVWLKLSRCQILFRNPEMISLENLQTLSLSRVYIDEYMLRSIINSCRAALKQLRLLYCSGFHDLEIIGAPELETIEVYNYEIVKIMVSETMSLHSFTFRGFASVSVATCRSIRYLELDKVTIRDKDLTTHLHCLHVLEELLLISCKSLRTVRFTAVSLKHLTMCNCNKVRNAEITAPKLESFTYDADDAIYLALYVLSLATSSITLRDPNPIEAWLPKFVGFLTQFNCSTELDLSVNPILNCCIPRVFRSMFDPPLVNVKHLTIHVGFHDIHDGPLADTIDTILWLSPHPDTIALPFMTKYRNTIKFQFLYNQLASGREGEDCRSCCASTPMKCWRHSLKEVKIDNVRSLEDGAKLKALFKTAANTLERIEGLPKDYLCRDKTVCCYDDSRQQSMIYPMP